MILSLITGFKSFVEIVQFRISLDWSSRIMSYLMIALYKNQE